MNWLKREWLQLLLLALPFCVIGLLWDKLPERVPFHWNARGEVNRYTDKAYGTLFLPCLNVAISISLGFLLPLDPRLARKSIEVKESQRRVLRAIRLAVSALLAAIALAIPAAALGVFEDLSAVPFITNAGIGVVFIVAGNLMGKLRPNYLIGIRTPWTLESKEVWTATNRAGGRLMVAIGIVMLATLLFVPPGRFILWILLPSGAALAGFSLVHSWLAYRKLQVGEINHETH